MKAHFDTFARYNAWANRCLYDAAAELEDGEYRSDQGTFFRSMHATLNHLLVTDRIWMQRITGQGDAPDRLDAILFDDLPSLWVARQAEDRRIVEHVTELGERQLAGVIRYRRVSTPEVFEQALAPALAHLFNHQTHHRGHAHAILTRLGKNAPSLDLLVFQRLVDRGKV